MAALFTIEDNKYVPTEYAGGPWSRQTLHGGSTAAILAHALEEECAEDNLVFTRVTFDLFRAAPKAPMTVETKIIREGKRIKVLSATLIHDGVPISQALATLMAPQEITVPDYARASNDFPQYPDIEPPVFDEEKIAQRKNGSSIPGYHTTVSIYNADSNRKGKGTGWLSLPIPIVEGTKPSEFVKVCSYADLGNGFGYTWLENGYGSLNTDITLYLQRYPVSPWVCLQADSYFGENGIGLNSSVLYDEKGPFGRVCETLMAAKQG